MAKEVKEFCRETTEAADGRPTVFRVIEQPDGKVKAEWHNHGQSFDSIEALKEAGVLNQHELQLLKYGVIR